MFKRFCTDSRGQDVIEYGLLIATLVIGTVVVFPAILSAIQTAWTGTGDVVYGLWEPPAPGA